MPEIDSDIYDWVDDYEGADTNTPQGSENPGETGEVNSLGAYLREVKSVLRRFSVDGYLDDPRIASRVSDTSILVPNVDLRVTVGIGQFLEVNLGSSLVYAYVNSISYSAPHSTVTLLFPTGVVTVTCESVRFSQFQPKMDEFQAYNGTSVVSGNVSPYPFHGGWVQCVGTVVTGWIVCPLPWVMPSTDYVAFLTCFIDSGVTAGTSLCPTYRVDKATNQVAFKLVQPPGGATPAYEAFVWMNY